MPKNKNKSVTHYHETRQKSPEHFLRYKPINMLQTNRNNRIFRTNIDFSWVKHLANMKSNTSFWNN